MTGDIFWRKKHFDCFMVTTQPARETGGLCGGGAATQTPLLLTLRVA